VLDDLGSDVALREPPRRVVSLVPSLTEAIAVTVPGVLVGATDWCTHPAGLDVTRVRGTKNPNRDLIAALHPDLVVANQEENRRLDVDRLRAAGIPVWVTRIDSIAEALDSLDRLFREAFGLRETDWIDKARGVGNRPGNCGPRRSGGGSAARRHRGKGPTLRPHISLYPFYNVGCGTSPARAASACG